MVLIRHIERSDDLLTKNTNKLKLVTIEILFEHGATLTAVESGLLHHALNVQNLALLKILIEKGRANPEEKNKDGKTVMETALEIDNPEIVVYLKQTSILSPRPVFL